MNKQNRNRLIDTKGRRVEGLSEKGKGIKTKFLNLINNSMVITRGKEGGGGKEGENKGDKWNGDGRRLDLRWWTHNTIYQWCVIKLYPWNLYLREDPKKSTIIFWRAGPLYYRLPPLGECSRNPSVSVYQLVLLLEAALDFNEFFWKTQCICPSWFTRAPAHTAWVFSRFWPKTAWLPCLTLPIHLVLPHDFFWFLWMKKSSKGNDFLMWKKWNKKQQKH